MADIQRDRDLVRLHWPVPLRGAFDALFAIDDALAEVVVTATQPALAAIKLAWWREALERLDAEPPPPEPRLQAAADCLLPRGVTGAQLGALEAGWAAHLQDEPDMAAVGEGGATLFRLAAQLLAISPSEDLTGAPGRLYAGVAAARRGLVGLDTGLAGERLAAVPRQARPLTALAALAARDLRRGGPPFEPEATPGRSWIVLRHRLTGII